MELPATVTFNAIARLITKAYFVIPAMTITLIFQLANLVSAIVQDLLVFNVLPMANAIVMMVTMAKNAVNVLMDLTSHNLENAKVSPKFSLVTILCILCHN